MAIRLGLDRSVSNYAVYGNPVGHSKSPHIHRLFAAQFGIRLDYRAIEVPLAGLADYVHAFGAESGRGLNITVPFKQEAARLSVTLSPRAARAHSVNTIRFDDQGRPHGDSTDGLGLINDLTLNRHIALGGRRLLILGAGGTVGALLEPLCEQKPEIIVIANRTLSRARELALRFSNPVDIKAVAYAELGAERFDLIINATSLSLANRIPPLPSGILRAGACCYDLMYADEPTAFMRWARAEGAENIADGLGMLVEQAAAGFYIWHGVKPETGAVIRALRAEG